MISPLSGDRAEYAELVTLRVGEHPPRCVALPDVDRSRSQLQKTLDLSFLVVGPEVEMKTVLVALGDGSEDEEQARSLIQRWPNLKLSRVVVEEPPSQDREPWPRPLSAPPLPLAPASSSLR